MATNKTVPTDTSIDDFLSKLSDEEQIQDSKKLINMFEAITGEKAVVWGDSIIGFGRDRLTYASGRVVDWMKVGFSPRVGKLTLYVTFDAEKLTSRFKNLGKYTTGKGCIYMRRLEDVNISELEELIRHAVSQGYQQVERTDGKEKAVKIE